VRDNYVKADIKKFVRNRVKSLNDTITAVKVSVFVAEWSKNAISINRFRRRFEGMQVTVLFLLLLLLLFFFFSSSSIPFFLFFFFFFFFFQALNVL
jgi:hypothetical protein